MFASLSRKTDTPKCLHSFEANEKFRHSGMFGVARIVPVYGSSGPGDAIPIASTFCFGHTATMRFIGPIITDRFLASPKSVTSSTVFHGKILFTTKYTKVTKEKSPQNRPYGSLCVFGVLCVWVFSRQSRESPVTGTRIGITGGGIREVSKG
jgi:hypothetical protein